MSEEFKRQEELGEVKETSVGDVPEHQEIFVEEVEELPELEQEMPSVGSVEIGKIETVKIPADQAKTSSAGPDIASRIDAKEAKNLLLAIAVILGVFIILFAGFKLFNNTVGEDVPRAVHLDDLHAQNLLGRLSPDEGYLYKDYSFVYVENLWWTQIIKADAENRELLKIPLRYGPRDLTNVEFSGELSEDFQSRPEVFVAIDPAVANKYYSLAVSELSFNMAQGINRRPVGSCTAEDPVCEGREIVNCENNPFGLPVLELELVEVAEGEPEVSSVEFDGACIKVSGSDEGISKAADYLLLGWYGIIERGEDISSVLSAS